MSVANGIRRLADTDLEAGASEQGQVVSSSYVYSGETRTRIRRVRAAGVCGSLLSLSRQLRRVMKLFTWSQMPCGDEGLASKDGEVISWLKFGRRETIPWAYEKEFSPYHVKTYLKVKL